MSVNYRLEAVESRRDWEDLFRLFPTANIYQTPSYGAVRWGRDRLDHVLVRRGQDPVAATQVALVMLRGLNLGVAYISRGPLFRWPREEPNHEVFRQTIRLLKSHYCCRGLVLNLFPPEFTAQSSSLTAILEEEGFRQDDTKQYQTLVLPICHDLPTLRSSLHQKWRNSLNRAERNNLEIRHGSDPELFRAFCDIYSDMHRRKSFAENVDPYDFESISENLEEPLKLQVFIALSDGVPISGVVLSAMGDTGVYLFGATHTSGLKLQGSYVLHWEAINWLKKNGVRWYDLGGFDPDLNPGVYRFKLRLAGKLGFATTSLGHYYTGPPIRTALFRSADAVRRSVRRFRNRNLDLRRRTRTT